MTPTQTSTLTAEDALHWLALRLIPGLGARRILQALDHCRSIRALFRASASELMAAGVPAAAARSIASGCTFDEAVDQQQRMIKAGAELVPIHDPRYPPLLKEIYDPPPLLFARGRLDLLNSPSVAVVGSRRPTTYGMAVSEKLSADLARRGLTVVSGMARGIDTAAHQGALSASGNTVAVFGCGVDLVYPAENGKLASLLSTQGLLLSEFPMATPAYPQNFPVRNRIVSGLSLGVLVVEGAEYSGSCITARLALDQNREVWCIPGNITSKMSWGPNLLIKQGAHLVQTVDDIVEALPLETRGRLGASDGCQGPKPVAQGSLPFGPMTDICLQIIDKLTVDKPIGLDGLIESLPEASSSEIIAALFELELAGLARQLPGKQFARIWV